MRWFVAVALTAAAVVATAGPVSAQGRLFRGRGHQSASPVVYYPPAYVCPPVPTDCLPAAPLPAEPTPPVLKKVPDPLPALKPPPA